MACYYFGEHGLMNIGDLIEANTGETGVVIGVEATIGIAFAISEIK